MKKRRSFFYADFWCKPCDVYCSDKTKYMKHLMTAKHQKIGRKPSLFYAKIYDCSYCNFQCKKESDWNRHLNTKKHIQNLNIYGKEEEKCVIIEEDENSEKILENNKIFKCDICKKEYKHYSSLYSHKKKCKIIENSENKKEDGEELKNGINEKLVKQLLKENTELKNLLVEQNDKLSEHNNILNEIKDKHENVVINNTQNNKFNINMFLNEKCNSAMNLKDFIERIEITTSDLENNAELGFVNGISKILMDNLKQLTLYERPIHCTDLKREIMYIKDQDTWQKEEDNNKLKGMVREVSRKSISTLLDWKSQNPDYKDMDSDFSEKCLQIQRQSTAGNESSSLYPKVIHILAKENIIDKMEENN